MDAVDHPLDWWAYGGCDAVVRELNCSEPEAHRKVRLQIADYYRITGNPIWKPIGSAGYAALRKAIMEGRVLFNDLV